jgi:hypothetical protein
VAELDEQQELRETARNCAKLRETARNCAKFLPEVATRARAARPARW